MAVTTYPGVYIEEFAPGAPIQGVGTSTAAFLGPAGRGDLRTPTKITSWDQFRTTFGDQPLPGFYLWFAVRGFFENGGQVCYVVRVSNGAYGELVLQDRDGNDMVRARARQPGNPAQAIQVSIAAAHLIPAATPVYQPAGTYTVTARRAIDLANAASAAQFRPGDWVSLGAGNERLQVVGGSGVSLRLGSDYTGAVGDTGAIRLADAPAGSRILRIAPAAPLPPGILVPGSVLTITQGAITVSQVVESVQAEPLQTSPAITTYRVTFRQGLTAPLSLDPANPATVQSEEFNVVVTQGAAVTNYNNLSVDPAHPRYFVSTINGSSQLVRLELIEPPPTAALPNNLPADLGATALAGGTDEDLTSLNDTNFTDALDALRPIRDVNLVAIPGNTAAAVQQAVIAHCELLADRFGVLDTVAGAELFGAGSIEEQRHGLDSTRGYAGFYGPWLRVPPSGSGPLVLAPPSGHVCGIMARSDNNRGVHKAPANENVNGAIGVERTMSDVEQGLLNLQGINIIRVFQEGGRPILWGARTTATDLNWQYVNIRRLFLYLEGSIEAGIRWAIFEPNNLALWQKLKRTINEFLTRVWRDGALFGATAKDAFYVRIDEVLNPFSEQALGRLNIEIGVRPVFPAEFIVVRIGIWEGGSEVSEV